MFVVTPADWKELVNTIVGDGVEVGTSIAAKVGDITVPVGPCTG